MLSIIVAFDEKLGIGKNGWMPWDLPEDLRLFKERTLNHPIIMGSTTFLGLPKPLKNRHTFVINKDALLQHPDVTYVKDLIEFCQKVKDEEVEYFVCGGASIYQQTLPYCQKMYISHVHGVFPADTYFPEFSLTDWEVISSVEYQDFTLKEYKRKEKRNMRVVDIIEKKKKGLALSTEEIKFVIDGYVKDEIPDYQISSLLMAIVLKGMDKRETADLTTAMIESGDTIDLSSIKGIKIDKHSTGGVGDKTSLALLPMVAACGCKCAKMSGRGLGFTGGTLDKLESISGFNVFLSEDKFIKQVNEIGLSIIGQTAELVPADKKLYALRDVTSTVDSLPLISSSIMSKKLASGSDTILLDVKFGEGAFMPNIEAARELAKAMIDIGQAHGKDTKAVLSTMDQPLGLAIGNALEVKEAIATLKGEGPADFMELLLDSGRIILQQAKICNSDEEALKMLKESITSGSALNKLRLMVEYQGGDVRQIDNPELLPKAKYVTEIKGSDGYLANIDTLALAYLVNDLGGGRKKKEDVINPAVGVVLNKKIGDVVNNEVVCYIHHDTVLSDEQLKDVKSAFTYSASKPEVLPSVHQLA